LSIPADDDDDRRDATDKSQMIVVRLFSNFKFSVEIFNTAFHCDVISSLIRTTGTPHFTTPHS
jgi:hypothetical protein